MPDLSYPKWPLLKCPSLAGFGCPLTTIHAEFDYPLHEVVAEEQFIRKTKVDDALDFILFHLVKGMQTEQRLRIKARKDNISDYAFHTALRELRDKHKIKILKVGGKGNRKLLKLNEKDT